MSAGQANVLSYSPADSEVALLTVTRPVPDGAAVV